MRDIAIGFDDTRLYAPSDGIVESRILFPNAKSVAFGSAVIGVVTLAAAGWLFCRRAY